MIDTGLEIPESAAAMKSDQQKAGLIKLDVLALDYDGTIAVNGVMDSAVRDAIMAVRRRGIHVILVTGRRLSDLAKLVGDLTLFDAIVAENGAVIAYPSLGRSMLVAQPPPPALLRELVSRGIPFVAGRGVVEAAAGESAAILSILRELELPLAIVFNRGRLMVLPEGVTKATGLGEVLSSLRLSFHNTLAIGDAENDHNMLSACEVGVAVDWGSVVLKRAADLVLQGKGPSDVAPFIRRAVEQQDLPATNRHRLLLGTREDGSELSLAVRGRSILISGDPKSGKSWIAGLLCEQLILQHYSVFVIDPEGDYRSLEGLPGVLVFGEEKHPPPLTELTRMLHHPDISIVADLSGLPHQEKTKYVRTLLRALATHRRQTGLPHRIVVDEAHYFLHDADVLDLIDLNLSGYTLVTYRASQLHPRILAASEGIIVSRETDPAELKALSSLQIKAIAEATLVRRLETLALNEAVLFPGMEEACGGLCIFKVAPRLSAHVRHSHKYFDVPVPIERAFVFTDRHPDLPARTLKEFIEALSGSSILSLKEYFQRHDFSRWIDQVFGDYTLAAQIEKLESRKGSVQTVSEEMIHLIKERYTIGAGLSGREPDVPVSAA